MVNNGTPEALDLAGLVADGTLSWSEPVDNTFALLGSLPAGFDVGTGAVIEYKIVYTESADKTDYYQVAYDNQAAPNHWQRPERRVAWRHDDPHPRRHHRVHRHQELA